MDSRNFDKLEYQEVSDFLSFLLQLLINIKYIDFWNQDLLLYVTPEMTLNV